MIEDKNFEYELVREGDERVLKIACEAYNKIPSLEDDPVIMSKVVDILVKVKEATKIVFTQKRDYEYGLNQTLLLIEIAKLFQQLYRERDKLSLFEAGKDPRFREWYMEKQNIINNILYFDFKQNPVGAFVKLKRLIRDERIAKETIPNNELRLFYDKYISILAYLKNAIEKSKLIEILKPELEGYDENNREIYGKIFRALIKPDFMYTKLQSEFPDDSEILDTYNVGDTEVNVFKLNNSVQYVYHIMPPEFRLSEEQFELLDSARNIMAEHKPSKQEFVDPQRMREVFVNIGSDLLRELAQNMNYKISEEEIEELAKILVRYTVGFGLIEVLLQDEKIQDVSVNSPLGRIPIFIVHQDYGDCVTNILPTRTESESWSTKLRLISGRPLDEANPILDTELELPGAMTRVAAVHEPFNPSGQAFAFRRHRDKPWTLPLFMKYRMFNALSAGLISFFIDGSKAMLIAGTRSSGKSSVLSSFLVEIMRRYRILTIEDTLELPTRHLRNLGYNIQSLKVESAMSMKSEEGVSAVQGIRSTLRLGDSALIVGEVRSKEAIALYEAMRIGAAANVVSGTIHADSPYGVYDRVVNDIGIPKTSFKATDLIFVSNPVKSPDGIHKWRRLLSITEVRKEWEDDPLRENAFVDLMKYNSVTDELEPTPELINGDSEMIKSIAANVKEWAGNWDAVWDNILLRAKIKQTLLDKANETKDMDMLEAPFVIKSNDKFHLLSEQVLNEIGRLDNKKIYAEWERWLNKEIKKRSMK